MTNEQFIFIMARICDDMRKIYHKINQDFLEDGDVGPYLHVENFGGPNFMGGVHDDWRVTLLNPLDEFINELKDHIGLLGEVYDG